MLLVACLLACPKYVVYKRGKIFEQTLLCGWVQAWNFHRFHATTCLSVFVNSPSLSAVVRGSVMEPNLHGCVSAHPLLKPKPCFSSEKSKNLIPAHSKLRISCCEFWWQILIQGPGWRGCSGCSCTQRFSEGLILHLQILRKYDIVYNRFSQSSFKSHFFCNFLGAYLKIRTHSLKS